MFGIQISKVAQMLLLFNECSSVKQMYCPEGSIQNNHGATKWWSVFSRNTLVWGRAAPWPEDLEWESAGQTSRLWFPATKNVEEYPELKPTMSCGRCLLGNTRPRMVLIITINDHVLPAAQL